MKTQVVNKGGLGLLGWMFLIFLTLKLTGYIAWSWLWVTAPLWIPVALVLGTVAVCGTILIFTETKKTL